MNPVQLVSCESELAELVGRHLPHMQLTDDSLKTALPRAARDPETISRIAGALREVPSHHRFVQGDARDLSGIPDESIHLVVTSPPYWTLKDYNPGTNQLGAVESYEDFVAELTRVWRECLRVLVPGGRLIVNVGDVCLSRREYGRHVVFPLHASIQESCREVGFDNLAPIIWYKIANAKFEMGSGGGFLGKPYEPNAVLKNDIEYILMQRRAGGYRSPSAAARVLSLISETEHREWFQQIWTIPGASTRDHPAPYPLELATRLIRMFSFVGDTVLDPFVGTGTTCAAAALVGRSSIGIEIDAEYVEYAHRRFLTETSDLFSRYEVEFEH